MSNKGQDILSLGINIDSFSEDKKRLLNDYISLFEKLSKYDGKVYNPVLGSGLSEFNSSLIQTSKLIDEINNKFSSIGKSVSQGSNQSKQITDLTLAMKEYEKQANKNSELNAKLSISTSDVAKQNAILKLQLSEVAKELVNEAKQISNSSQAKISSKQKSEEYRQEQLRVVSVLRQLAIEQDEESKRLKKDEKSLAIQRTKEYRREQMRVVESLRQLAREQDKESSRNKSLLSDYDKLKIAVKEQADAYSNLYYTKGKDHPETKAALAEYSATSGIITDINQRLNDANGSSVLFAGGLRDLFSQLRIIAYILPGIGIAGIFNLAYDAIGNVVEELGLFNNEIVKAAKNENLLSEAVADQINLFKGLYQVLGEISYVDKFSQERLGKDLEFAKTRGTAKDITLPADINNANIAFLNSEKELKEAFGSENNIVPELKKRSEAIKELSKELSSLNQVDAEISRIRSKKNPTYNELKFIDDYGKTDEEKKSLRESLNNRLNNEKEKFGILLEISKKYYSDLDNLENLKAEKFKFDLDEERKKVYETSKSNISVSIDENSKIYEDEINSEKRKLEALKSIKSEKDKLAKVELENVTTNISSTQKEKDIAQSVYNNTLSLNKSQFEKDRILLEDEYYQRRIKALTQISKDEVEKNAIRNEKLFKDDNQSLSERLNAYSKYIVQKQQLQDLEFLKDIERRGLKADDPTVKKELEALRSSKNMQQSNIQADAERQVYEIVSSSLKKELKLIIDINNEKDSINKVAYANELRKLNDLFEQRKLLYKKYKEDIESTQKKFKVSGPEEDIVKDKENISRLDSQKSKLLNLKKSADSNVDDANAKLEYAKSSGEGVLRAQKNYDIAVGNQIAINDAIFNLEKESAAAREKLKDDELARELARIQRLIDAEKEKQRKRSEYLKAFEQIEKAIYNAVKTIGDRQFDEESKKIDEKRQITREQYDDEIAAIDKSSLSNKDKTALDIQLNAQKEQSDKNLAKEQKKIAHDKAVFDKELAIAHIILSTSEAVAENIAVPVLAAAAFVAGMAELAVASSVDIPSYKYGTGPMKHPGGLARYGEDGTELIKEPGKNPYLVFSETISNLPVGTEVIPIDNTKYNLYKNDRESISWDQIKFLAKALKPKDNPNIVNNKIVIDLGFESYKKDILGI